MVQIDLERDNLFDSLGIQRLKESYMREEETSPQERFAFVSEKFSSNPEHAQRLYDYSSKHWLSYATPILSFGRTKEGLPISCFLPYIDDSRKGLVDTLSETNWLSMLGGGIGIGIGIRSADDKSVGIMPHLKIYDASSLAYRQGKTRRGSYSVYLDISHPDILLFIEMRKPTGDPNLRAPNLHHGVNIPDSFMRIIEKCMTEPNYDDSWELIDPHSKQVKEVISAKYLWEKLLDLRMMTGEPYFHFIDRSNEFLPKFQKDKGLYVNQSNLCTEITLPTNKERTAVCCLSSVNIEYYDEWKDNELFISDIMEMLDNVLQYFIDNAPDTIARAKYSAMMERSVGLGALGFHAYLQKHMIPFESAIAKSVNKTIFKKIKTEAMFANLRLGLERGEAPDASGTGLRFSHMTSIAPNATTSIIMGNTSPSIEPFRANAYRQDTLSGSKLKKNIYLDGIIQKQENPDEIWSSIISNKGSCQHLDFLTEHEKAVFKTAMEIDQRWIIEHSADRQEFIDQSQSVNVFFPPNVDIKYLHIVHFLAWKKGMKSLYYCRSEKIGSADKISQQIAREKIEEMDLSNKETFDECLACQG